MADDKGGSDLDVFEGLAKKSSRASGSVVPPPPGPPASVIPKPPPPNMRTATLLGVSPSSVDAKVPSKPPPPSLKAPPPPPPGARASAPPAPPPGAAPGATLPSAPKPPLKTPPPPASPKPASTSTDKKGDGPKAEFAPTLLAKDEPPKAAKSSDRGTTKDETGDDAKTVMASAPPAAQTLLAAVAPPPAPPPSIGSALGIPDAAESSDELTPPHGAAKPGKGKGKKKTGANVDMEWEEEEESTHVFADQRHGPLPSANPPTRPGSMPSAEGPTSGRVDARSAALLAASGATAKALPPPAPLPAPLPKPLPPPVAFPARTAEGAAPFSVPSQSLERRGVDRDELTPVRPAPAQASSSGRIALVLSALALVSLVGLAVYMFMPRKGQLKIDLKSKSGASVAKVEIFVDGKSVCETTPCVVSDLSPGSKDVKVILPNGTSEETSAAVEAGKENLVSISIDDSAAAAPSASASGSAAPDAANGTGFKAEGQSGAKVLIDGKEAGTIPFTKNDLAIGEHTVKFDAGDDYQPVEKKVTVKANSVEDLGDIKLKVLKGHLTIELKTSGAHVVMTKTENGKSVEKKLDDEIAKNPPEKININTKEQWTIVATKKGFDDFKEEVKFDDGAAEKTLTIELNETGKVAAATPITPGPGTLPANPVTTRPPETGATSGMGTLNIGSIPAARVLLDGSPVGTTPIAGRQVTAGPHTVVFVFDSGRKTVSVNVPAGKSATASAKGN